MARLDHGERQFDPARVSGGSSGSQRKKPAARKAGKPEAKELKAAKKPPAKAAKTGRAKPAKAEEEKSAGRVVLRRRTRRAVTAAAAQAPGSLDVIVVPPYSTIEGVKPHVAAIGPDAVIAVRATTFEVTPPDQIVEPVYPGERETELPAEYGDTKLVFMVRDPEWVFFYWEVGPEARKMVGLPPEGPIQSLVVRLHDVTGVEEFNGTNSVAWYEIPLTPEAICWYLRVPQVDREWCGELGVLNAQGEFVQICRSNRIRTPRNYISVHVDSEWMAVAEEVREILAHSADVTYSRTIGSEAAIRQISRRLRMALEKYAASPIPSGSIRAVRMIQHAEEARATEMPLTVCTELIVSGATDPRATVTIQGQPVVVRPDGSFSVRFELPEGEQVIPVRAVRDEDGGLSREITPVVRRETRQPSAQ